MVRVQVGEAMKPPKKWKLIPTGKYLATLEVVDNIPEGAYIAGFEKEFVSLFKKEIIEKCFKQSAKLLVKN